MSSTSSCKKIELTAGPMSNVTIKMVPYFEKFRKMLQQTTLDKKREFEDMIAPQLCSAIEQSIETQLENSILGFDKIAIGFFNSDGRLDKIRVGTSKLNIPMWDHIVCETKQPGVMSVTVVVTTIQDCWNRRHPKMPMQRKDVRFASDHVVSWK